MFSVSALIREITFDLVQERRLLNGFIIDVKDKVK